MFWPRKTIFLVFILTTSLWSTMLFDLIVSFPLGQVNDASAVAKTITDPVTAAATKMMNNSMPTTTMAAMVTTAKLTTTTERPPNNVSILEMTPNVNHALTIDHQNSVINLGQSLSLGITNAIVRPLTFFNNLIGSAAGSLPGLFAANGAALGAAIATPIQLGTLAANAAISGITGTIVSIPISLASGGAAQLVGLVGTGRQLWHSTMGSHLSNDSNSWSTGGGELLMQPLAVITGANSILAGVSLNALSQGVKNIGAGIERFGVSLSNTGRNAQRLGTILVGWANGRPIYASVVNNTDTNQIGVDFDQMIPVSDLSNLTESSTMTTTTTMAAITEPIITTMGDIGTTLVDDGQQSPLPSTTMANLFRQL